MIRVKDESDFRNWFKKNYKILGFQGIIKSNTKKCPDFIMSKNGKEIKVELEVKSSNFLEHHHPIGKVDLVVCVVNNKNLDLPTIEVPNLKLVEFKDKDSDYSFKNQIVKLFKKEKILTTSDVKNFLNINWGTAEKALLELVIEGKVIEKKKKGVNLWLKK